MSEMIERVAQAIHASMDAGFPKFTRQRWEDLSGPATEAMLRRAHAAIEAMREPTDEMALAPRDMEIDPSRATFIWHEMIDAALGVKSVENDDAA